MKAEITTDVQAAPLQTLRSLHVELKSEPVTKRNAVLKALGVENHQAFYDILSGQRPVSPAEKVAIASIYGKKVEEINWLDVKDFIA